MAKAAPTFGTPIITGDRLQYPIANAWQTADVSVSPKLSPLTVSSSVLTIAVPTNAIRCILFATGSNDVRVSELLAMTQYILLVHATGTITIDVAGLDTFYVVRDAGADATLQFVFLTL